MYYTYIIECGDGSLYTGITTDPQRRQQEHLSGGKKAAKYTRTHKAGKIAALWSSKDRSSACRLEYYIKTLSKDKKNSLVQTGDLGILALKLDITEYSFIPYTDKSEDAEGKML